MAGIGSVNMQMNLPYRMVVSEIVSVTIRWIGITSCVYLITQAAIELAHTL